MKAELDRWKTLSEEDEQRLCALLADTPDARHVLLLGLHLGVRKLELQNLIWAAVDLDAGSITVPPGKGPGRIVPIGEVVRQLLAERDPNTADSGFVLGNAPHRVMARAMRQLRAAALRLELPWFRYYSLRYTFASRAVNNGMPLTTLMAIMGYRRRWGSGI
jgi:integrase